VRRPTAIDHACSACGAEPGGPCRTKDGGVRSEIHEERRALAPMRMALSVRLKRAIARMAKMQDELEAAQRELVEERKETRRLRRLLSGTDVGAILSLRRRLAESEAQVRRLKMEILD
jgi:hypothetical protein